jgi:hypothetical protein
VPGSADRRRFGTTRGHAAGPETASSLPRRVEAACALLLTLLIVLLHVYRATRAGGLWRDEVGTVTTATMPSIPALWESLTHSTPPALPYLVVRLWSMGLGLGTGDASLRVLGALQGIGLLLALWVSRSLFGSWVPWLSIALLLLNPTVIQWGDSPRGYGLGAIGILLAYATLWRALNAPTPRRVALAIGMAILSVHTLFENAPLVFAIGVAGAWVCFERGQSRRAALSLGIGAVAALTLLPYVPIIDSYRTHDIVVPSSTDLPQMLSRVAAAFSAGEAWLTWGWLAAGTIGIVGAIRTVATRRDESEGHERRDATRFHLRVVLLGTASYLLFLVVTRLPVHPWHCVPLIAVLALALDELYGTLPAIVPRVAADAVVVAWIALIAIPIAWKHLQVRQTDVDIIASMLSERVARDDFVVVNPYYCGLTFQRYYRGAASWTTVPPIRELGVHRFDLLKQEMKSADPLRPVYAAIEKTLRSGNCVWWVGNFDAPRRGEPLARLEPASDRSAVGAMEKYQREWTLELGDYAMNHVTEASRVDLAIAQPLSPYEDAMLQRSKGWRP